MKLTFDIAKRYLISKKSTNAINIITWISILGISIGTAALIIILAVFNGFESLIGDMFSAFNPDIKVSPIEGKYFDITDEQLKQIEAIPDVEAVSRTIEEVAIFEYNNIQKAGIIKGVDDAFSKVTEIDSMMRLGNYRLTEDNINYTVIGRALSINLNINVLDPLTPVTIYMPMREKGGFMSQMGKDFKTRSIYPTGTFMAGDDTDTQYMLASFQFVNELLSQVNRCSFLEIKTSANANEETIRMGLNDILGEGFRVENRYQQDAEFLKIMNIEKWVSYLITCLVLFIIAFNMVGSLWMIVLEKKKDLSILSSMGYTRQSVRSLIIALGLWMCIIGIGVGIILAIAFYLLQVNYGLIGVPSGFMINAYPVELRLMDFIVVIITVLSIGMLASLIPAHRAGILARATSQNI